MHKAYIYTRTHTHIRYLHLDVSRRLDRLSVEQRAVRAVQVHDVRPAPPVISDSIDVGRSDKSQMPGHQNGLHIGNRFLVGPTQESTGSSTPVHQRGVINAASSTPVHQRGVINAGSSSAIVSGSVQKCRSIKTVYSHPQRTSPVGPGPRKVPVHQCRFISSASSMPVRRRQSALVGIPSADSRKWSSYVQTDNSRNQHCTPQKISQFHKEPRLYQITGFYNAALIFSD